MSALRADESVVVLPDESRLAEHLARLDSDAWQTFFEQHYAGVQRFAYVKTGDRSAAEELAAEAFAEAARSIHKFQYRGVPVAGWLYRIARNIIADHIKRRKKRVLVSLDFADDVLATGQDIDNHTDLANALQNLSVDQQEVVVLRFFNDCSIAETAMAMGKSADAVKQLQRRAIAALRQTMQPNASRGANS